MANPIVDFLTREAGRISEEIRSRSFARSPWIELVKRAPFPRGMGEVISNLTYERTAPTEAEPTWSSVAIVDGQEGGTCLPPATKIAVGSTIRNYALARRVLEGPDVCATDSLYQFQLSNQLDKVFNALTERTIQEWEYRYRHEYFRNTKRKVVCNAAMNETNTIAQVYPAYQPTSRLTQGILNKYKAKLNRDGAGLSAMARSGGKAVFTLMCSQETSDALIFDNADIRQDIRWAEPGELLKPFGVQREYRGFIHMIDEYPRRFSYSGGVFTEIPVFTDVSATKGNKSEVNSDWEEALYEESSIYDPTVFISRIPEPITKPHARWVFDPVNFLGDWKLMNILHRTDNPDGTIVYHRGTLASGSEPGYPERGVSFIHLRCDPSLNLITACS